MKILSLKLSAVSFFAYVSHTHIHIPVKHGGDTGLSDRDSLLFHRFVDRHSVLLPHFIELRGQHEKEKRNEDIDSRPIDKSGLD